MSQALNPIKLRIQYLVAFAALGQWTVGVVTLRTEVASPAESTTSPDYHWRTGLYNASVTVYDESDSIREVVDPRGRGPCQKVSAMCTLDFWDRKRAIPEFPRLIIVSDH